MSMRYSFVKKPGLTQRNTSVRPPPGGNPSGGGVGAGSSSPFGNVLAAGPASERQAQASGNDRPAGRPTVDRACEEDHLEAEGSDRRRVSRARQANDGGAEP